MREHAFWGGDLEERLMLAAIFLFALLVRVAVIDATVGFHAPAAAEPAADSRIHIAIVKNILEGRGYSLDGPTAITPPLYIFLLAGLYRVFNGPEAVRLVQAVLGACGCVVLFAVGRRMIGYSAGLAAALILSLHPLAAYLAGLHLTEDLFLFLVLLVLLQSLRVAERPTPGATLALGGLIGLAALTRAAFLGFLPFVLAWTASLWGVRAPRTYYTFGIIVAGAVLIIMPWTIRNYLVFRAIVPVQSNGGMVFWAGNNSASNGGMAWPTRTTWTAGPPPDNGMYGWRGLSLTEENRRYVGAAVSWIREHPRDYFRLLLHKFVRLYGFDRATDTEDLRVPGVVVGYHTVFLMSALLGLLLTFRRWQSLSLLLALIVFTHVTALIFSGATRYTMPMIPSLSLFAAIPLTTRWTQPRAARTAESLR